MCMSIAEEMHVGQIKYESAIYSRVHAPSLIATSFPRCQAFQDAVVKFTRRDGAVLIQA